MLLRSISLPMHGALELPAGLAVAIVPLALGLVPAGAAIAVCLGAVMIGLALGASAPRGSGSLPVSAHAAYDKLIAGVLLVAAVGAGIAGSIPALAFSPRPGRATPA